MVKHIIFDFDGVIADSLAVTMKNINLLANGLFNEIGPVYNKEDMERLFDVKLADSLAKYGYDRVKTKSFYDAHSQLMNRSASKSEIKIMNGISKFIHGLPTVCSIISSSCLSYMQSVFKGSDLKADDFNLIIGRETNGSKGEKILWFCDKYSCAANEVIYIGDTASDVLTCQEISVPILAAGFGFHSYEFLMKFKPDYCVHNMHELEAILSNLCKKILYNRGDHYHVKSALTH
jgi:phosphoglycolate phosphatase-like HAD superfamily hydrolase